MSPDFHIVTPRLVLKIIEASDAAEFAQCIQKSSSLFRWIDWCHSAYSEQDAEKFILATRLNWVKADAFGFGIFDRESNALMGMVAINELYHTFNMASLGYWVADKYQRQGIAKEAMLALFEFCFAQLKLTRLEIVCDLDNLPSQHLIEACGATREAIARNRFIFNGQPKDGVVYAVLPPSYGHEKRT
ncbi:GNAT family N-acetyltransferase [Vibrio sp. D404a]|uniref:GNAT family N-acetyltransferase n=1 Tax=unclassified Vibrio TaxID=2614977 RepID=UPI002556B692|nr:MULTISPECIES: GNAT family protein [unclassified Vibrio]MDK9737183.1 GNAT family N-acetyltransferase [Vibrio sp. D404a]MDK9799833.1 GNAT family N-acetyltransferase [Vibrio sp. D449a]